MILSAQSFAGTGVALSGKIGRQKIEPSNCQFAPCVNGLSLWLQGDCLFETLMLNLVPRSDIDNDKPAWEDDSIVDVAVKSWKNPISFTGSAQRFAPQSRFIRVIDQQSMFFTNGLKTDTDTDSQDPMKAYSRPDDKSAYQAVKLNEDKAAWRDVQTLIAIRVANCKPPESLTFAARLVDEGIIDAATNYCANVVGLATDQGSALLWRHERIPVPITLLDNQSLIERLGSLIRNSENIASALDSRIWNVARYFRVPADRQPNKNEKDDINNLILRLDPRPAYWAQLEKHFLRLLEELPNDWDEHSKDWKTDDQQSATRAWRKNIKREAERALQESIRSLGTTARAIQAVARVRTDFNDNDLSPVIQKVSKLKSKGKGGKKK